MRNWKRDLAVAAAVAVTVGSLSTGAVAAPPGMPATPSDHLLVVQANLQDAVRPADATDTRDLDNFVARLVATVQSAPDALLLTEVLGPGASRVADVLGRATGHKYRVVVAPGDSPFLPDGALRESAIVINTTTLRLRGAAGFHRVQSEDQAYALVEKTGKSGLRAPLVSAHVNGAPVPATEVLASFVAERYPPTGSQIDVLGGDFRSSRCAEPLAYLAIGCAPAPFWDALTLGRTYRDATFERGTDPHTPSRNYLFARGDVRNGYVDAAYRAAPDPLACKDAFDGGEGAQAPAECRDRYYADQPFNWALLAAPAATSVAVVPQAVTLSRCELGTRVGDVVARAVNDTDTALTHDVAARADAPLTVTPATATLDVPARQARNARIVITTDEHTPVGTYPVSVRIGDESFTVPVTVPAECTEPGVYATSWHSGFGPENATDGDVNTFWHSEYIPATPLPQSITLNLREVRTIDKVTYQPRVDGNLNGTILTYKVYISTDGKTFTEIAAGTWDRDARGKTATFPPVPARYVRLEAHTASGGSYASAAEVTAGSPQ